MLTVRTNVIALTIQRNLDSHTNQVNQALERLSTGKRINSAKDDAAGLAIVDRMRARIRGTALATRNVNDAVSMLQVSEGGFAAITQSLQRMRELALQAANGIATGADRAAIQLEVDQLKQEIDRTAAHTQFNGLNLLDRGAVYSAADFPPGTSFERIDFSALAGDELTQAQTQVIVDQLQNRWLGEAEQLILEQYGISGDGASLTVVIDETPVAGTEGFAAYVRSSINANTGLGENIELHINLPSFLPLNPPNSGNVGEPLDQFNGFGLDDRIIAHELVHAVARRNINTGTSRWFEEGLADFIHGGDERVAGYLSAAGAAGDSSVDVALPNVAGNNVTNRDALALEIGDGTGGADAWNTAGEYASSYAAVRFLDQAIRDSGGSGIRDVIDKLKADPVNVTVDTAIAQVLADLNARNGATELKIDGYASVAGGIVDEASFLAAFRTGGDSGGGGSQYIRDGLDIVNQDTGSIAGADVTGGQILNAADVIPDEINFEEDPLAGFAVMLPAGLAVPAQTATFTTVAQQVSFQIGPEYGDAFSFDLGGANLNALRLGDLDVSDGDASALEAIDKALAHVSAERARVGASLNRLESINNANATYSINLSAAASRIEDADFAAETANLTKYQILQQVSVALLAQANAQYQLVLGLLE